MLTRSTQNDLEEFNVDREHWKAKNRLLSQYNERFEAENKELEEKLSVLKTIQSPEGLAKMNKINSELSLEFPQASWQHLH